MGAVKSTLQGGQGPGRAPSVLEEGLNDATQADTGPISLERPFKRSCMSFKRNPSSGEAPSQLLALTLT